MTALELAVRNQLQTHLVFGDENKARAKAMFNCEEPSHQQCWDAWIGSPAFEEFNREYSTLCPQLQPVAA
jgi:hypothetical protein